MKLVSYLLPYFISAQQFLNLPDDLDLDQPPDYWLILRFCWTN